MIWLKSLSREHRLEVPVSEGGLLRIPADTPVRELKDQLDRAIEAGHWLEQKPATAQAGRTIS